MITARDLAARHQNLNPREVSAAFSDALVLRSGAANTHGRMHPLAEQVAEMPLAEVAEFFGKAAIARDPRLAGASNPQQIRAVGMNSSDFTTAMANGVRDVLVRRYEASADHRLICHDIAAPNFKEITLPSIDLGTGLLPVGEGGKYQTAALSNDAVKPGESGQLVTYGRLLFISRHVLLADEFDAVLSSLSEIAATQARTEARQTFELLESNPELADGEHMFHEAMQTIEEGTLTETTVGSALSKLRLQQTRQGDPTGYRASWLLVDPRLELRALRLVRESAADLQVVSSPWIEPGRWYLMADPTVAPVIGRLHLRAPRGVAPAPFRIEPTRMEAAIDGVAVKYSSDFGVMPLSRLGIVRGGE